MILNLLFLLTNLYFIVIKDSFNSFEVEEIIETDFLNKSK